jgi:hypothetical protein
MGQMRFFSPDPSKLTARSVDRAYLAGMEGIPWCSRNILHQQHLILERPLSESGNLLVPWQVEKYGEVVLSTASLMETNHSYHLPLELARGTLNRLRALAAEASTQGWTIESPWDSQFVAASRTFVEAMTIQDKPRQAAQLAEKSLSLSLPLIDAMTVAQSRQLLATRRQTSPRLPTLLAGSLESSPPSPGCSEAFVHAFHALANH